jgi:hypothetical protein
MATTLIDVWTSELAIQNASLADAKAEMAASQLAMANAKKQLDDDARTLKKLIDDIAADRKALSVASVPSEVAQLNAAIRDQMIEQRRLQGVILDDQEAVTMATPRLDASTRAVNRAQDAVASAKTAVADATKAAEQRDKKKKTLTEAPLKTLKADATAFSTSAVAIDAQAVMNANIPTDLQDLVIERHATRISRDLMIQDSLALAETARAEALGAVSGVGGTVAEKELAFNRAEEKLNEYVEISARNYDNVVSLFKSLQKIKLDPTKNPDILSPAQKTDAKSSAPRIAAAQKAISVDGKMEAVIGAEKDLDAGVLSSIDTDVDAAPADPAVKALRDALKAAQKAFTDDRTALSVNGERKLLDEWEIVVPDAVWQQYVDYVDAMAELAKLKSTDSGSLVTSLDTAEDEYALALIKAAKARRRVDAFSNTVDLRTKRAEMSRAALPGRLLSAARGDTY